MRILTCGPEAVAIGLPLAIGLVQGRGNATDFHLKTGRGISYIGQMEPELTPETEMTRQRGEAWLARSDLRPTRQRVLLASLLVGDGLDRHVTAEWLHDAARNAGDKVSLATVYNTLRAFSAAGLVQEITVDGTGSYFDTRLEDHPHFYWESSGSLTDAAKAELSITKLPTPPEGMEIAKVDVVIRLRPKAKS